MPTSVMISLLRKGQTGAQILEILDSICEGTVQQSDEQTTPNSGTLEELQFWFLCDAYCVPPSWHWGAYVLDSE